MFACPVFSHRQTTNTYRMPAQLQLAVFNAPSSVTVKPPSAQLQSAVFNAPSSVKVKPQTRIECRLNYSLLCLLAAISSLNQKHVQLAPSSPSDHKPVQTACCFNSVSSPLSHKHIQHVMPAQIQIAMFACSVLSHRQTTKTYRLPTQLQLAMFTCTSPLNTNTYRLPEQIQLAVFNVTVKPQTCTNCQLTTCCVSMPRQMSPVKPQTCQLTTCSVSMPRHHRQTTNTYNMECQLSYKLLCSVPRPQSLLNTNTYRLPAQLQLAVFNAPFVTVKIQTRRECQLTTCCVCLPRHHR